MKHICYSLCAALALHVTGFADQASDLDKQIAQFKAAKVGAERKAYQADREASRLMNEDWQGYKKAAQAHEMYEQQVKDLDEKIVELEKQRAALSK